MPPTANRPSRLLLLVQHREGYRRLCELLTRAYQENFIAAAPRSIPPGWLTAPTACWRCRAATPATSRRRFSTTSPTSRAPPPKPGPRCFPGRYYLELQRFGQPHAERLIDGLLDIGAALNLPAVATHPIQFIAPDDFKAHEARVCIAEGMMLGDPRRPRPFTAEQYFKTPDEMAELFADLPEASAEQRGNRQALQSHAGTRQEQAARFPDARRHESRRLHAAAFA